MVDESAEFVCLGDRASCNCGHVRRPLVCSSSRWHSVTVAGSRSSARTISESGQPAPSRRDQQRRDACDKDTAAGDPPRRPEEIQAGTRRGGPEHSDEDADPEHQADLDSHVDYRAAGSTLLSGSSAVPAARTVGIASAKPMQTNSHPGRKSAR
jgi:hypothetical protein